jgi:hypothetical protein
MKASDKSNVGGSSATGIEVGESGLKFTMNPASNVVKNTTDKSTHGGSSATGNKAESGVPTSSGNGNVASGPSSDKSNKKGIPLWKPLVKDSSGSN